MTKPEDMGPCRRCSTTHKKWTARAHCLMPDARSVSGVGRWAVLHPLTIPGSGDLPTPGVHLYATRSEAEAWIACHVSIPEGGCSASCSWARDAGCFATILDLAAVKPWPKGKHRERLGITARRGLMSLV